MRFLIYGLGSGWGHLQRSLSLARELSPIARSVVLTNSPWAKHVSSPHASIEVCPATRRGDIAEWVRSFIERPWLTRFVDVFPRGAFNELDLDDSSLNVLIQRDIKAEFIERHNLKASLSAFDCSWIPMGERAPFEFLMPSVRIHPLLICDPNGLRSPDEIRLALGLDPRPLILVIAAGNPEEQILWGQITNELLGRSKGRFNVRCISPELPPECPPELWVKHWPAMELLPAASVVVGGAGFNLVNECLAIGVPLISLALWRRLDDQKSRAFNLAGNRGEAVQMALAYAATAAAE